MAQGKLGVSHECFVKFSDYDDEMEQQLIEYSIKSTKRAQILDAKKYPHIK